MSWSEEEEVQLRRRAMEGKLFYSEIAKELGKLPAAVRWKAKQMRLPSNKESLRPRFAHWNKKHKHLRGSAMKYFMTHSSEETQKRFNLKPSEFKSLMTIGYRLPQFKHLRKETRTHESWSAKELKFLLRHAGLRPRDWIVSQLNRGKSVHIVKDRLKALGIASRNLQGITLSQFREAFGRDPEFFLQTDAGPIGVSGKWNKAPHWKIVPWVWLEREVRSGRLQTVEQMKLLITVHAQFQEWIFEGNALAKMKRIVRGLNQ